MYYEINVSLNGVHFFATAERSITNACHLERVYEALKASFSAKQGYAITVTEYTTTGKRVKM